VTGPRIRKSGRRVQQPAATAPHPWLIPLALFLLVVVIYLFYYLDHLPQSETIKSAEVWRASPREQLRLHGMPAGPAIFANLREAGTATLSFEPGATLLPDVVQNRPQPLTGRRFAFSLANATGENVTFDVRLSPASPEARSTIVLESDRPDTQSILLTISSPDSPLRVDATVVPNSQLEQHGQIQWERETLHNVSLVVPRGRTFTIGLPSLHFDTLLIETGDLSAVEIGSEFDGDFERKSIVCGARRGMILWQRLLPDIRLSDCGPGRVSVESFGLNDGVELKLAGPGFTTRDGATHYWAGFRKLRENDVVKSLVSALLVALIGWVIFVVRRKAWK